MIQLQTRKGSDTRTEHFGFRCTPEQAEQLRELAEKYRTTVSDVILQLVKLASENK